jgi:hypothetical protein
MCQRERERESRECHACVSLRVDLRVLVCNLPPTQKRRRARGATKRGGCTSMCDQRERSRVALASASRLSVTASLSRLESLSSSHSHCRVSCESRRSAERVSEHTHTHIHQQESYTTDAVVSWYPRGPEPPDRYATNTRHSTRLFMWMVWCRPCDTRAPEQYTTSVPPCGAFSHSASATYRLPLLRARPTVLPLGWRGLVCSCPRSWSS